MSASERVTPVGENAPYRQPWRVTDNGLRWNGDWKSAGHLADLLNGEDEGRISDADVRLLLDIIALGVAVHAHQHLTTSGRSDG